MDLKSGSFLSMVIAGVFAGLRKGLWKGIGLVREDFSKLVSQWVREGQ